MQFDLLYEPPFSDLGDYLLSLLLVGSIIGAVWALLTSARGRATPSLRKAWLFAFAVGAYAGGFFLGLDLVGIQTDFHVLLFSLWLTVAALLAGLVLFLRRDPATRDLGRLTYQSVSLAGLGFFVFLMTAFASSSAFH